MIRITSARAAAVCAGVAMGLAAGCQHGGAPRRGQPAAAEAPRSWLTPTQQIISPAGREVELPGMRPQTITLSPDGRLLVVAGITSELIVIDPQSGAVVQHVKVPADRAAVRVGADAATNLNAEHADKLSFAGLVFSPDGRRLYFSNVNGSIKVFTVDAAHQVAPLRSLELPEANAPGRQAEIPAGLALSPDGRRLYVVGNLSNRLFELDAESGRVLRTWNAGVAPLEVVLAAGKAYVSNMGGRRPDANSRTAAAGRGTLVRVDARSIADEGSVSIIDLASGAVRAERLTGPHAGALAVSPDRHYVVVANAGDDTLSVLDTRSDEVVEKIWARQSPSELYGAQPCALAFNASGSELYVCNSTQNAVAVVRFEPRENDSRVTGLVPAGWFPAGIAYDGTRRQLCVANLKGRGADRRFAPGEKVKYRTKDYFGTVSLIAVPRGEALERFTRTALHNLQAARLAAARLAPRPGESARPVPERVGEPSVFKHVIYIIKENRSYDQILGDMSEGRGDPSLCTFGETVTPNSHALARDFVLLDNTYCAGVQSGDGHQWADSGFANDYVERELVAGWPRSYPSGKDAAGADSLAYANSGFIWDNARAHGKTFRNYGEWMVTESGWADGARKGRPTWRDFWKDYATGTHATRMAAHAAIPSLARDSSRSYVGWDLRVPDVMRAQEFIRDLKAFEANGDLPNLVIILLPNDHTGGTRALMPSPRAQIADNDLALGRIVDALSHSRFWRDTCLFAIEDDPQEGWDHVSGYRTTCYVASAFTKRHTTVSTNYNQLSVLRTMELMLGLPPMNQLDATATPMDDCFMPAPDLTPFTAVPNQVPLDEITPPPQKISNARLRADAIASSRLPLDEPDKCDENVLNQILWRSAKGDKVPFPRWAVKLDGDDD